MINWKKIKGLLTVTTVIFLILFVTYTSQIFVIWPYLGPVNTYSMSILVPLNFFIVMILINYFLTCKTDPGLVPSKWIPEQYEYMEVKKSSHSPRFCKTCNNYKPPRTHHCSTCNRCVLKMDHHCPWVNNCVGYQNYGHFIRLLVYVDISTIYLLVLLSCRLVEITKDLHNDGIRPPVLEAVFISINMVLTTTILTSVGILTCYHVYCITTNTTTIEGWEKGRSLTIKGMGRVHNVKCPYDQGIYKNIQVVLGCCPLFWFIPKPMSGSGLVFPINLSQVDEEQSIAETFITSLKRSDSAKSHWSSISSLSSAESEILKHNSQLTPLKPVRVKPTIINTKGSIVNNNTVPNTPGSVLTFTSNASTLVDFHQYQQHYNATLLLKSVGSDYSIASQQ